MKASGEWNKLDPKNAKIIALITQVSKFEKALQSKGNNMDLGKNANAGNRNNTIDLRRTEKKGDKIVIDGVTT